MPAHPKPKPRPQQAQQSANDGTLRVHFAGQLLQLHASGAVYWPEFDTLIFADINRLLTSDPDALPLTEIEEDPFSEGGVPTNCAPLQKALQLFNPQSVLCLGDPLAQTSLPADIRSALCTLVRRVPQWTWVTGTPESDITSQLGGDITQALPLGDCIVIYAPMQLGVAQICGQLAPTISHADSHAPAFVHGTNCLILPPFGVSKLEAASDAKPIAEFCGTDARFYRSGGESMR